MKTIKKWLDKVENLYLLAGSLFFVAMMINFVLLHEKVTNVYPMVIFFAASFIFFYLAVSNFRQADRTLQMKKFSWGQFIFGLVLMITPCVASLLFSSALGKTVDYIVKGILVICATLGAIVIVLTLKRIHISNRKDKSIKT